MKKTVLLAGLMSMLCGGIAQAAYIGAIDVENKPFEFSLGANGTYAASDRKAGDRNLKTAQSIIVGQANISVKGWQLGLAGGGTNWEYSSAGAVAKGDVESKMLPYARVDIGGPIFRGKVLTIGPFLQASYSDGFEDTAIVINGTATGTTDPGSIFFGWINPATGYETLTFDDTYEITAGLRFQVEIEGAYLYGGPAYFWSESEVSSTLTAWDSTPSTATPPGPLFVTGLALGSDKISAHKLGVIGGIRWPLETGLRLDLEGQWFDGAGVSAALSYPF